MDLNKIPVRKRKAIMIRPSPDLLDAMEAAAVKEGISLNKLALEIIENSGRLGTQKAAGTRAVLNSAVSEVEAAVRKLRSSLN